MNRSIPGLLLMSCLLLGGCWQANGSLYPKADPVTPFHAGALTMTGKDKKPEHFALTLSPDHSYRMIGTDKGTDEFGEGFILRIFNLRGISDNMYFYEAVSLSHCNNPAGCDAVKAGDPRYYGLVHVTAHGVEEIRPDCDKDAAATKPFGIKSDSGTCTFASRDSLETSLTMLAQSARKPNFFYRLK